MTKQRKPELCPSCNENAAYFERSIGTLHEGQGDIDIYECFDCGHECGDVVPASPEEDKN